MTKDCSNNAKHSPYSCVGDNKSVTLNTANSAKIMVDCMARKKGYDVQYTYDNFPGLCYTPNPI